MGVKRVVVHIDRLTLPDAETAQGGAFATALERELTLALADPATASRLATQESRARLRATAPASGNGPRVSASAAARSIAAELTK